MAGDPVGADLSRPLPIMSFNDQDRQGFVTLSASFGSIAMGREMLRCPQHDRTGFDWEKSLSALGGDK